MSALPNEQAGLWVDNLAARRRRGVLFRSVLIAATLLGIVMLALLLFQIVSQTVGWVAIDERGRVVESWTLGEGLFDAGAIDQQFMENEELEGARLEFR